MTLPLAYLNGRLVDALSLSMPVYDAGFVLGATVTEQLRTFGGTLFRLEQHLERFFQSLAMIRVEVPYSRQSIVDMACDLAERNHQLLAAGDDLGLCIFATPGPYAAMAPPSAGGPVLAMHTFPLPFSQFAAKYRDGQRLAVSGVRQIPAATLPRALKCRSRMHYFLADQQVRDRDPAARAVLLDDDDSVLEATTANLLCYTKDEGLVSPPAERILPGISVAVAAELASELGVPLRHRDLSVADLLQADEILLTSTSMCVLPAVALNGQNVGDGRPGECFVRLVAAWSKAVGVDIVAQAQQFSQR
ncbi:MAG: aminotransferase class IV [Planctomycetales bacterium]|nr:aminotransferase class IV [Planctomycetales bacterium]